MNTSHHAAAEPKRTPVLMAERRTEHYGVTQRATQTHTEPGFVVFKGESNAEVVAHFFYSDDAKDYAAWKNGKETT